MITEHTNYHSHFCSIPQVQIKTDEKSGARIMHEKKKMEFSVKSLMARDHLADLGFDCKSL